MVNAQGDHNTCCPVQLQKKIIKNQTIKQTKHIFNWKYFLKKGKNCHDAINCSSKQVFEGWKSEAFEDNDLRKCR